MTEVGESIAVPGMPASDDEQKLVDCEWKECEKTHTKKPGYSKDGTVKRNSTYESDWVKAKLEPWELYGPGKDSQAELPDYREETPEASYAETAAALEYPEYHTQKHHLISVNLFEGVSELSHNAQLIGYDVNHKNNGICLPSYILDIVQHNLQCHRGSHPKALYNDKIKPLLANLERRCKNYCLMDTEGSAEDQARLMGDLNRLSQRIEEKINSWSWLLRKNAHAEREKSKARYANLN